MNDKFTVKQLFSLTDGRLSTSMDDVSAMLTRATGRQLLTHELPIALNYIKEINPDWYVTSKEQLEEIKKEVGDDFTVLMEYYDAHMSDQYSVITEFTEGQKAEFTKYMLDNRLI